MSETTDSDTVQRLAVGIDIGGTSTKVVLLSVCATGDGGGGPRRAGRATVVASGQSSRYSRPDAQAIFAAVAEAAAEPARAAAERLERDGAGVAGIGLCCPGVVEPGARAVSRSVNMPGLVGVPLDELAASAVPGRTGRAALCSDALAAATDWWAETGEPRGRLLAISLGTGVGASVLDDGVPLHVCGTSPGHLGQVDVGPIASAGQLAGAVAEPVGPDGGRGSVEAYLGLPALRDRYGSGLGEWFKHPRLDDPPIVALTRVLRIAHAIYRPQQIAVLGGVGLALGRAPVAGALRGAVADQLTSLARPEWTLRFARHMLHAAAGAARLAAEG